MTYCSNCGAAIQNIAKFCPSCGTSQEGSLAQQVLNPRQTDVKQVISKRKLDGEVLVKVFGILLIATTVLQFIACVDSFVRYRQYLPWTMIFTVTYMISMVLFLATGIILLWGASRQKFSGLVIGLSIFTACIALMTFIARLGLLPYFYRQWGLYVAQPICDMVSILHLRPIYFITSSLDFFIMLGLSICGILGGLKNRMSGVDHENLSKLSK